MSHLYLLLLVFLPCIFPGDCVRYNLMFNTTWVNELTTQDMLDAFIAGKSDAASEHICMHSSGEYIVMGDEPDGGLQFEDVFTALKQYNGNANKRYLKVILEDIPTYDKLVEFLKGKFAFWLVVHFDYFRGPNLDPPPVELLMSEFASKVLPQLPQTHFSLGMHARPGDSLGYTQACIEAFEEDYAQYGFSELNNHLLKSFTLNVEHISHTKKPTLSQLAQSLTEKKYKRIEFYLSPGEIKNVDIASLKIFFETSGVLNGKNLVYFNVPDKFRTMYFSYDGSSPPAQMPDMEPDMEPKPNKNSTKTPGAGGGAAKEEDAEASDGIVFNISKFLLLVPMCVFLSE